tara:strand:- start:22 stop:693 length:672 start_codon:yes stop_codon:yes gene_type:complete
MTPSSAALRLVVCGTDTDVGKTVVSALLVQGLNAIYWKPVQSGLEAGGDRERIMRLIDLPSDRWIKEAYAFHAAVSPHWAAELEDTRLDPKRLTLPPIGARPLVVETAGGLHVPLTRTWQQIDQLQEWMLPVVLVARSGLGTLNHTLLSLEALRNRRIPVIGLILNGPAHADNPRTLAEIGDVPVLAELPPLHPLNRETLQDAWHKQELGPKFEAFANRPDNR